MPLKLSHKALIFFLIVSFILLSSIASYAETVIYKYDDLNRLTRMEYVNEVAIEYVYDEVGNRTQKITFTPVTTPSDLTAVTISLTQIDLSWVDNSDNETGFKIERKTGVNGIYSQIDTVNENITAYSDTTGLSSGTTYYYRVKAYNAVGESGYSNETFATTLPLPPDPPSGLSATAVSSSQIDLSWVDNSNNETGFYIERKEGAGGTYAQIGEVGADVTSYSDSGLISDTEYYYRTRAYNAVGESGFSNEANDTTLPLPSTPSGLVAATISASQIDLSWTDNADNEDGFIVERKEGIGGTYEQICDVGANITGCSDTGLLPATEYYYRVKGYNTGGESAYSPEASATTLPLPPDPPSVLSATAVSSSQIDLAWTDNSNNEDGFYIERKTGVGGTYVAIATVGADVTSYLDTGLMPDTTYYYIVCAANAVGESGYSNEAYATTVERTIPVPWDYEDFHAHADGLIEDYLEPYYDSDSDDKYGPPLPVSANVSVYRSPPGPQTGSAGSTISDSEMTVASYAQDYRVGLTAGNATAEFSGSFYAVSSVFEFSYYYDYDISSNRGSNPDYYANGYVKAWLSVYDFTDSIMIYEDTWIDNYEDGNDSGSGTFSISVPVGHEIDVQFGIMGSSVGSGCIGESSASFTLQYSTALVCSNPPVRNPRTSKYYYSIQEAYDDPATVDGDIIESQAVVFAKNPDFNLNKSVTLIGGYDCDFNWIIDMTILQGNMAISNGTVTIENFILE